jgi:hypothetical protein
MLVGIYHMHVIAATMCLLDVDIDTSARYEVLSIHPYGPLSLFPYYNLTTTIPRAPPVPHMRMRRSSVG